MGAGAYPALAANRKLVAKAYSELLVLRGQKAMSAFGPSLSDGQVAAVVNMCAPISATATPTA